MRLLPALVLSLSFSVSIAETRFLEGWAGRASDGDTFTLMLHEGGVVRIRPKTRAVARARPRGTVALQAAATRVPYFK